jgi:hypothetical protein
MTSTSIVSSPRVLKTFLAIISSIAVDIHFPHINGRFSVWSLFSLSEKQQLVFRSVVFNILEEGLLIQRIKHHFNVITSMILLRKSYGSPGYVIYLV